MLALRPFHRKHGAGDPMNAWVKKKISVRKALEQMPGCEVEGCKGKAMGHLVVNGKAIAMCPSHALKARGLESAGNR